jgi:ankyrin repeat protein
MSECGNLGNKKYWKPRKRDWKKNIANLFTRLKNLDDQLWHAIIHEPDKVEYLLEKGANSNSVDCHGYTPLIRAAQLDNVAPIKALLKYGADINAKDYGVDDYSVLTPVLCSGETALMVAAAKGNTNVVKELLINGANPKMKNKHGKTAIMLAESSFSDNKNSIIRIIISYNKNVNNF